MLLDVVALSFLVGFLRGGRIKEIPRFRYLPLLVLSLLFQITSAFVPQWGGIFVSVSYVFMLFFFFHNREYEDIRIFLVGWLMNAIAIWSNNGKMPIDLQVASKLPYSLDAIVNGTDFKHTVLTAESNLPFLTDVIYMPLIIPRVISIGDIFIMIGAFLLIQRIMGKPISLIRLREGKKHAV